MTELRVVRTRGDGMTRGMQIGGELADLIQRSVDFYHRYLERRGVSSTTLQDLLTPHLVAAENAFPESVAVLKGMSMGAMVPILELFAINAFEELEPLLESPEGSLLFLQKKEGYTSPPPPKSAGPADPPAQQRCSSLTVALPGTTLLAHNEHWLAGDLGNVAVVIDVPESGRVAVASPTVVCCLPAVGMNAHGGAQGIGSLTASDDRVGVPRVLVSRSSLEARDREDAIGRASVEGRAGGYGHVYAFRGGDTFVVETSATEHRVQYDAHVHTNHYLDGALAAMAPPPSEGSTARFDRLTELLDEASPRHARGRDGDPARPRIEPAGDLPASRSGRGRRGVGRALLHDRRRGGGEDVGCGRQPVRGGVLRDRPPRIWCTLTRYRRP